MNLMKNDMHHWIFETICLSIVFSAGHGVSYLVWDIM